MIHSSFIGERVKLRPIEPEDIALLYIWENDPSLSLSNFLIFPISKNNLLDLVKQVDLPIQDGGTILFIIETREETPQTIGYISLYNYSYFHRRGAIGILIDIPYQSRGLAKEALSLFLEIGFSDLLLRTIYAEIDPDNLRAIELFRSCHFEHSATLPQWNRMGKVFRDLSIYTLDENRYEYYR